MVDGVGMEKEAVSPEAYAGRIEYIAVSVESSPTLPACSRAWSHH
jgi:hypothetical protein